MLTGLTFILIAQGHSDIAAGLALAQGSYRPKSAYSGTTHCGCGVVDFSRFNQVTGAAWTAAEWDLIVAASRMVGFAAWHRLAIAGLWAEHAHLVAIGCPELDPEAVAQVSDYLRGLDGLASHGPDTGPRTWVNATWEQHSAAPSSQEVDMPLTDDDIQRIWAFQLGNKGGTGIFGRAADWITNMSDQVQAIANMETRVNGIVTSLSTAGFSAAQLATITQAIRDGLAIPTAADIAKAVNDDAANRMKG